MSERLVHHVEAVEVEGEQADEHPAFAGTAERFAQLLDEQGPIWKTGEFVVERECFELLSYCDRCGDVAGIDHNAADRRVIREVLGGDFKGSVAAVLVRDA